MAISFRIPKQTDRELVTTVGKICDTLPPDIQFRIFAQVAGKAFDISAPKPEASENIAFVLDEESQVLDNIYIHLSPQNTTIFNLTRSHEQTSDNVSIPDTWQQQINNPNAYVRFVATAKAELKASTLDSSLTGSSDTEWGRYRDAQTGVVNSLQQAAKKLILDAAKQNIELEKDRAIRFAELETTLRGQIEKEREALNSEHERKQSELLVFEESLKTRESSFNTKEARYVARQKQDEQIAQVKGWLENWTLTRGTSDKRKPVSLAYLIALSITGLLTIYITYENVDLLKGVPDLSKLSWWHWILLTLKSAVPLGAFITFMVYFIRWTASWARQHSDEEFRNRGLLIDLGRSSWLLEAVRDGNDGQNSIPPELMKELSRNLFSNVSISEGDIHPQAVSDVLLQGLSSIRIKSPDGSEVEASRSKNKKDQ